MIRIVVCSLQQKCHATSETKVYSCASPSTYTQNISAKKARMFYQKLNSVWHKRALKRAMRCSVSGVYMPDFSLPTPINTRSRNSKRCLTENLSRRVNRNTDLLVYRKRESFCYSILLKSGWQNNPAEPETFLSCFNILVTTIISTLLPRVIYGNLALLLRHRPSWPHP